MRTLHRKILTWLLCAAMCVFLAPEWAMAEEEKAKLYTDGDSTVPELYYIIENDEVTITGVDSSDLSDPLALTIPATIEGCPVIGIGDSAFMSIANLTNVILPNTLKRIGANAFYECSDLTGITIPGSVTEVGDYAFAACTNMTEIVVSPDNEVFFDEDGVLFLDCMTAEEPLPLTLVQYPAGRQNNTYEVPDYIQRIGNGAFEGCDFLQRIKLPGSVHEIGIGAFSRCRNLLDMSIPSSVMTIDNAAFSGCISLANVKLSKNMPSICNGMFSGCMSLMEITIPGSITLIEQYAFYQCDALTTVHYKGSEEQWSTMWIESFNDRLYWAEILYEGADPIEPVDGLVCSVEGTEIAITGYTGDLPADVVIPEIIEGYPVTSIEDDAFLQCIEMERLTIPARIVRIGERAFFGCFSLHSVIYGGTSDKWATISADSELPEWVTVICMADLEEGLDVSIETEEVPGGIAVTMAATGGENLLIRYTLDGSAPGEESIPYNGTFLLNKAGEYNIQAIALDKESGGHSDVSTAVLVLEQSVKPSFETGNGEIRIVPAENVYYTLNLTEEPTKESLRYTAPLTPTGNLVIRARVIEPGKAASDISSEAFQLEENRGLNYPSDSYSFVNKPESFGYGIGYRIPNQRYGDIFGPAAGALLYDSYTSSWGGSCFGMSATSLMFLDNTLSPRDYNPEAQEVYELNAPRSKDSELTRLIERYQIAQFLPDTMKERDDPSEGGTMVISGLTGNGAEGNTLLNAVIQGCHGDIPVVLILWRQDLAGSHAVVPYRVENGRIYIYDCNKPGEENYVEYTVNDSGTYSFQYGIYSYAVSYNRLDTLLEGLEDLQRGRVVLASGDTDLLLVALNSPNYKIMREDGTEVTNYIQFRETEDMVTDQTLFYIEKGNYIIQNQDPNLTELEVATASQKEYYRLNVGSAIDEIEIGEEYGHLYISARAGSPVEMHFSTQNEDGQKNELDVTADYAKTYARNGRSILVDTTASTVTMNGTEKALNEGGSGTGIYQGGMMQKQENSAGQSYEETAVSLSADLTELPDGAFTLTAIVTGTRDNATIYAACYDPTGRMLIVKTVNTEQGKTKYPFGIPDGTAEVRVFLLEKTGCIPLTEMLRIGRE